MVGGPAGIFAVPIYIGQGVLDSPAPSLGGFVAWQPLYMIHAYLFLSMGLICLVGTFLRHYPVTYFKRTGGSVFLKWHILPPF